MVSRKAWAAGFAVLALVAVSCSANRASGSDTTLSPDTPTSAPFTDPPPDPAAPSTTITKVPLAGPLDKGSSGEDVKRLQRRLLELRFDPGGIDGTFGDLTVEAVWAYKKLVMGAPGSGVDAKVTPEVWDRMQDPLGWTPKKQGDTQNHLEVYLPQQVAVLVRNGVPALITHISTGNGKDWCNYRRPLPDANPDPATSTTVSNVKYCGKSITPAGSYRFTLKRQDWYSGYYGDLYNPVFFNGGIAVHGFNSVPNYPASHGCIRIPNHIANYFQTLVHIGDQVFVFDGQHDPDTLGAVPGPADVLDPNATTTTVAPPTTTTVAKTTTTVKSPPPTTVAAPTTIAATTAPTTAPVTTTTAKP